MMVPNREAIARRPKAERRKIAILLQWAAELYGQRARSSLADQRYASIAWALSELGAVTFVDVERRDAGTAAVSEAP